MEPCLGLGNVTLAEERKERMLVICGLLGTLGGRPLLSRVTKPLGELGSAEQLGKAQSCHFSTAEVTGVMQDVMSL